MSFMALTFSFCPRSPESTSWTDGRADFGVTPGAVGCVLKQAHTPSWSAPSIPCGVWGLVSGVSV